MSSSHLNNFNLYLSFYIYFTEWQIKISNSIKLVNSLRPGNIYVLKNCAIISSGNYLSPFQHKAITWTNDDLLPTEV